IEKLSKFTGEHHEMLTPGQFTQLTGRAGRRGIDDLGTAVVLWSPYVPFDDVASLARSRRFELRSAFRPTYNMAANLVYRYEQAQAKDLLARSFAQFQTARTLERMSSDLAANRRRRDELVGQLGSVDEARAQLGVDDATTIELTDALSRLQPGDVIDGLPGLERAVVLSVAYRGRGRVRVRALDADGTVDIVEQAELDDAPQVIGRLELPSPYEPGQQHFQHETARRLRTSRFKRAPGRSKPPDLAPPGDQRAVLAHHDRLEREIGRLEVAIERRSSSLDEQFEAVMAVLADTDHIDGWELTTAGHRLRGLYHERDLLLSLAIGDGVFDGVDGRTLAGLLSCVTYEHRSSEPPPTPWFPSPDARRRAASLERLARDLQALEDHHGLTPTPAPDPSIFAIVHAWTAGQDLEDFLDLDFLSGGDFVRNAKQLIDVLRQFGHVVERSATAAVAREAADALRRGVVAASSAIDDDDDDDAEPAAS
ncbi:MAG: hypothetical protein OES57_17095, partial [Acidimicrobiia bacterium]|nr:hypothetical protein [Acidimicrobiia bacterium]